jgi:hypothetical protein
MNRLLTSTLLLAALLVIGCDANSRKITFSGASIDIQVNGSPTTPPTDPPTDPPPTTGTFTEVPDITAVQLMPASSAWYQNVDTLPVHPRSLEIVQATTPVYAPAGRRTQNDWGHDFGMPYSAGQGFPAVPVTATYAAETDPGPYHVPLTAPIETNEDAHLLYYDLSQKKLYELFATSRAGTGFNCGSAAIWDSTKGEDQRTLGWTSADAAGLPILPLLVRFDEFKAAMAQSDPSKQMLNHALRYTLTNTGHAFVYPARHYASTIPYSLPGRPPMGMRIRVKKSLDLSQFNLPTQVLLRTLQYKGAILADNGANWFISGTRDPGWATSYGPATYFDAITGNVDGKRGFKSFAGAEFDSNVEIINFTDADLVTQVE